MTVRKLIAELKKLPQNLQVYYAHNDNSPWEQAGEVFSVEYCVKEKLREQFSENINSLSLMDRGDFESLSKQWIAIRG